MFKSSPAVRMWVRVIVLAILSWFVQLPLDNDWSSRTLISGALAVAYAIIGLLTPMEPMVGIKSKVEVPRETTVQV